MAREFAGWVEQDPRFELSAPVEFSLVCFRMVGTDDQNRRLLDRVNASGYAFLSNTTLGGKFVLRLAIGNIGASEQDIRGTWERIVLEAEREAVSSVGSGS